jgi:type IV pilus assembly protein PilA
MPRQRPGCSRRPVAEDGFTLIELMVVLLIIAILLAIAIPTFLGTTNSASIRSAQSNLTNALVEAKSAYQNGATYSPGGTPVTPATLASSAAEFSWVTGGCGTGAPANCISEQVVDVASNTDGQGIVLAAFSSKDHSCWYAADVTASPGALSGDTGVPFVAGGVAPTYPKGGSTTVDRAGVFYAKKAGADDTTCNANWAATRAAFNWGTSYAAAGTAA